jgi:hypothetical protein
MIASLYAACFLRTLLAGADQISIPAPAKPMPNITPEIGKSRFRPGAKKPVKPTSVETI